MTDGIFPEKSHVWGGEPLVTGSRIALRARRYSFRNGQEGWSEDFGGSAGMLFRQHRYYPTEPDYDYLVVNESTVSLGAQLTIETWPKADGEYFRTLNYVKCILQAENGKYLESNSIGALRASASQNDARVFCLVADTNDGNAIYDAGYTYGRRETLDRSLGASMQGGIYTLMPQGCPPAAPYVLSVIQGFNNLDIVVVGRSDLAT